MTEPSPLERPWPRPAAPWRLAMRWHDLLFAHWPFDAAVVAQTLPPNLELDLFEGKAWLGVIPFRMTGVRPSNLPGVPWLSSFPELNVRTYVTCDGKPGVWFFSLDAARWIAVKAARATFHLPYVHARMSCRRRAGWIEYESERIDRDAPQSAFTARYRPVGPPWFARRDTLDHFLTARFCLYAKRPDGTLLRGEIDHAPWPLRRAECEISRETMLAAHGFDRPSDAPVLHFAERLDVAAWAPERVR